QVRVPRTVLALTIVLPGPLVSMVTLWDASLAPKVTARLLVRLTGPAKRLRAQPLAGSPTRMGTVALDTLSALAPEGPETTLSHRLKKPGALATMPPVIEEPTTVSAPPGFTVTGPATRAPVMTTLSPALTVSGPVRSPVTVRVGAG